jgi:hypothetical protein
MNTQKKTAGPNSRPEITLIKKSGVNAIMSKRIFLDQEGHVCSDGSQCKMAEGIATRATAETAGELAKLIASCGSDQAFALGKLRDDVAVPAKITTVAKLKDHPGAIARTREYIDYAAKGPAWALIDFDSKGMPPEVAARIEAGGGMWNALLRVAHEEATAASVALIAMHEIWGHHSFTAKDVVEAMTPEDADDQAKAESIANALEGLDGKRLDRPDSAQRRKALPKTPGRSTFMDRGRTNGCHIETVGGAQRQYLPNSTVGVGARVHCRLIL